MKFLEEQKIMNSEEIILNAYKNGHLTLEESVQLLRDVKSNYPWVYPYYPTITYEKPDVTITCIND